MSLLLNRCRNPQLAAVRSRILNVLPAASFQMQKLLGLLDIEFSETVPTAAIECTSTPRLLLNPDFLAKHCQGDGDLFLLVMHELHHVILGHTRLFSRVTRLDNIVFDVVINAMLCRQFHATVGVGLFTNFYDWSKFPERLLRPPPDWPHADRTTALAGLSKKEVRVFEALYYSDGSDITYFDLYRLLLEHCKVLPMNGDGDFEDLPLLGSHGEVDDTANPLVQEILRDIVGGWPPPPVRIRGRDEGTKPERWLFPEERDAGGIYRRALHSLLIRCGILSASGRAPLKLEREPVVTVAETFLPQARDRRAPALRRTLGVAPLLYRTVNTVIRPRPKPVPVTHVYMDISGSMNDALPFITQALRRPLHEGRIRLFGFSTIVSEIPFRQLAGNLIDNTRGTDINAVLQHLAGISPPACPRRVLLLTDGYVGQPAKHHLERLRHVQFDTGLTGIQGFSNDLQNWTRLTVLPSLESKL